MESLSQEPLLPQVETALLEVLTTQANALARPTGLIQRQGKLTGADFARLLVLGFLHDPQASLDALAQFGADLDIDITAQGIDQRFGVPAAPFLGALFEVALAQVVMADPVAIPLLARFGAVVLEESTSMRLPDELAGCFRGCGGHQGGKGTMAACKLQGRLEMRRGQLTCSSLLDGRQADTSSPLLQVPLAAQTLTVRDRGYVDIERWMQEVQQDVWAVTYYKSGIKLFDRHGQPLALLRELARAEQQGEWEVLVGEEQRLPMRLLFTRVPEEVAQQRRAYLRPEALTHGRGSSHESERLAGWTVVLSSVPDDLLRREEAIVLLRLRWQIELLIKLWKHHGRIDEWRSRHPWRILCEIYAKVLAMRLHHWLLVVSCWQEPHRSLSKAAKAVRSHANMLATALVGDLPVRAVLRRMQRAIQKGSQLNRRRDAPNTSQVLLEGLKWSQKPLKRKTRR